MPPTIDPTKPIQTALMIEKPKSVFCGVNISEIRQKTVPVKELAAKRMIGARLHSEASNPTILAPRTPTKDPTNATKNRDKAMAKNDFIV